MANREVFRKLFQKKSEKLLLVLFFISSFFLNTIFLGNIPSGFHGDEAEQAFEAILLVRGEKNISGLGWYGLSNASFLFQGLGLLIFGITIFGARISSAFIGTITIIFYYFLIKELFSSRRKALFASLLLFTSHWWLSFSRLGLNHIQAAAHLTVSLLAVLIFIKKENKRYAALAGFMLGITPYLYFAARVTPVIVLPLIIAWLGGRGLTIRKKAFLLGVMLLSMFIVSLPFLVSASESAHTAFMRTNEVFIYGEGPGSVWREKEYGDLNAFGVLKQQASRSLHLRSDWEDLSGQYGYRGRVFDLATLTLIFFGIVFSFNKRNKLRAWYILSIWISVIIIFGLLLTIDPPFSQRLVGLLPAIFAFAGAGLVAVETRLRNLGVSSTLSLGIVFLVIIAVVVVNLRIYFIVQEKSKFGDPNKYIARQIVDNVRSTKTSYDILFLKNDLLRISYGPFIFMLSDRNILEGDIEMLSSAEPPVIFVISKFEEDAFAMLMEKFPGGQISEIPPRIILYKVD